MASTRGPKPPAAAIASATREPAASRYTPGCSTAPATSMTRPDPATRAVSGANEPPVAAAPGARPAVPASTSVPSRGPARTRITAIARAPSADTPRAARATSLRTSRDGGQVGSGPGDADTVSLSGSSRTRKGRSCSTCSSPAGLRWRGEPARRVMAAVATGTARRSPQRCRCRSIGKRPSKRTPGLRWGHNRRARAVLRRVSGGDYL